VRALPGYADTAGGAAVGRLLGIAAKGARSSRVEALDALGLLAEDHGEDPCGANIVSWTRGSLGSDVREVRPIMETCATRLRARTFDRLVRRVAAMASDPEGSVRQAAAQALGRFGSPRGRAALRELTMDTFEDGSTLCTGAAGASASVCEVDRPVARAALEALEALKNADEARAEDRMATRGASPGSRTGVDRRRR
jgi:HEAT repeat protein